MTGRSFQFAGVAAAIVAGTWLRFAGISSLSLWFDEGYTAWVINHPARDIPWLIRADTAPPLYYLLLHVWSLFFGTSETALRSFSAVLGIATIPLVTAIAGRTLNRPVAVVAATWIFALSFPQIWYSQEARGYELTAFLTAVMLYTLLRYLAQPSWSWLILLITTAAAGLYVNNFMIVYIFAIGVAGFVFPWSPPLVLQGREKDTRLRHLLVAAACLAVIYLPWLAALRSQIHRVDEDFWIPSLTTHTVCQTIVWLCGVGNFGTWNHYVHWIFTNPGYNIPVTVTLALICGVLSAANLHSSARRTALALAIVALLPPLLMAVYSLLHRPIFLQAAFLPSTVVLPIFMAGPLVWSRQKKIAAALVAAVLMLITANLWGYETERTKENWRGVAAAVAAMPPVSSRLLIFVANEGQLPFDYYYTLRPGEVETGAPAGFFDLNPPRTQRRVLNDSDLNELRRQIISGHYDDVVLIVSHDWYSDPGSLTEKFILEMMPRHQRIDFPQITLWQCQH